MLLIQYNRAYDGVVTGEQNQVSIIMYNGLRHRVA